ncbi:HMG box-containing protein C19G7.04 [Ceratocystis fimbriata CBS 114723]|uniref:HMG box-containing protein C19G7.04 n=1 Tax=Ceratocystis fimbriata CBS 114723 TaxID=1035309 RepID=A0A2C5X5F0_9PEZI|nr:HMG box-containing protein C19G7.04 [Ceratocystis fimbriata CBS 114723]
MSSHDQSSSPPQSCARLGSSTPSIAGLSSGIGKISQDTSSKLFSTPHKLQGPARSLLSPKKAPGSTVKIRRFADSQTLENPLGKIDRGKSQYGWIDLDQKLLGLRDNESLDTRKLRTRGSGIKPASRGRSMASFMSFSDGSDNDDISHTGSDLDASRCSGLDDFVPVLVPNSLKIRDGMDADTTLRMNWREPRRLTELDKSDVTIVEGPNQHIENYKVNEISSSSNDQSSAVDMSQIDPSIADSLALSMEKKLSASDQLSSSMTLTPSSGPTTNPALLRKLAENSAWCQDISSDFDDSSDSDITGFVPSKLPRTEKKEKSTSPIKKSSQARSSRNIKKEFEATKHEMATKFLAELDAAITKGKIAEMTKSTGGVQIVWSNKLNTTAGRANWSRKTSITKVDGQEDIVEHKHFASIELATKVIANEERLLNVIAHEYCHLANFIINNLKTNPHGREFKAWATQVSNAFGHRGIEVTTRHSYDIDFKYAWECSSCGLEYQRHSKSINPERQRCGKCKSVLVQTRPTPRSASGKPSEYQSFMKIQMKAIKAENPTLKQKDIMRMVGDLWAEHNRNKELAIAASATQVVRVDEEEEDEEEEENLDDLLAAQLTGLTLQK